MYLRKVFYIFGRELLNTQYQDYNVDVEYNRGRGGNDSAAKMMNGKKIVTDLIVHKRERTKKVSTTNPTCIENEKRI